jgi:uncharacterized protein (UPF0147 family)
MATNKTREPRRQAAGDYAAKLLKKYIKYSDTPENVRRAVDESMCDRRLTDILYEVRGKR